MTPFHEGERQVQERAGVRAMSERVGKIIGGTIPPAAQEFLRAQPMLLLGGADSEGRVWASLVTGQPGFARTLDEHTLRVEALPVEGDPLRDVWNEGEEAIGVLAIEFATRRRMRLNGLARQEDDGLTISAREVYSNCPKYIQKRTFHFSTAEVAARVRCSQELSPSQKRIIEEADTFFIATIAGRNADLSHRGGGRGFVRVEGQTVIFPDYAGNAMFNTLGNLQVDERAGFLFVGENGDTLQLSGRARVRWESEIAARFAGAERVVELRIERVVAVIGASPLRWEWLEASPFNPTPSN